jgi:hypothetical protein
MRCACHLKAADVESQAYSVPYLRFFEGAAFVGAAEIIRTETINSMR